MYGVAAASDTPHIAAAYIHVLGKFSYDITRPVFFNETMKLKYSEDKNDSEMWDYVIESQSYDVGRLFCEQIGQGSPTVQLFRQAIMTKSTGWNGILSANAQRSIKNSLTSLNNAMKELP
jgi:hypothetical protein